MYDDRLIDNEEIKPKYTEKCGKLRYVYESGAMFMNMGLCLLIWGYAHGQ